MLTHGGSVRITSRRDALPFEYVFSSTKYAYCHGEPFHHGSGRGSRPQAHYFLVATYLITFSCHATHLPGQEGTIDRAHNIPGTRVPAANASLHRFWADSKFSVQMDAREREVVLTSIRQVCEHKDWLLHAAHVRSNHVHAVVSSDRTPEFVMNSLKAYAGQALGVNGRWARHGSTRHLWSKETVDAAVHYVLEKQGIAMARYPD
jgi:REP element-mobilizing transposase RayT